MAISKCFKALLDKNASIEAMTKEGETPLHLDLLYGHFEVVKNASTGSKTKDQIIAESLTSLQIKIMELCSRPSYK